MSDVAVKLMVSDSVDSNSAYLEAIVSRLLSHPNVLQTYEFVVALLDEGVLVDPPQALPAGTSACSTPMHLYTGMSQQQSTAASDVAFFFGGHPMAGPTTPSGGATRTSASSAAAWASCPLTRLTEGSLMLAREHSGLAGSATAGSGLSNAQALVAPSSRDDVTSGRLQGLHRPNLTAGSDSTPGTGGAGTGNTANTPTAAALGLQRGSGGGLKGLLGLGLSTARASVELGSDERSLAEAAVLSQAAGSITSQCSNDSFDVEQPSAARTPTRCSTRQLLRQLGGAPGKYATAIIMEYADEGTLLAAIRRRLFRAGGDRSRHWALRALLRTAREVALGMAHLHSMNIIHGE